jgi:hypothetical protein
VLRVEGRGNLLYVASTGGWDAVKIYLASIIKRGEPPDKKIKR